jgi:hypothetical protein
MRNALEAALRRAWIYLAPECDDYCMSIPGYHSPDCDDRSMTRFLALVAGAAEAGMMVAARAEQCLQRGESVNPEAESLAAFDRALHQGVTP